MPRSTMYVSLRLEPIPKPRQRSRNLPPPPPTPGNKFKDNVSGGGGEEDEYRTVAALCARFAGAHPGGRHRCCEPDAEQDDGPQHSQSSESPRASPVARPRFNSTHREVPVILDWLPNGTVRKSYTENMCLIRATPHFRAL